MPDPLLAAFLLLVLVPFAGAVVTRFAPARWADALAALTALADAALAVLLVTRHGLAPVTVPLGGLAVVDRALGHPVVLFGFQLDALGSLVLLCNALIGVACVLYSAAYVGPRNREIAASDDRRTFYFWLLTFIGAMSGLVTSCTLLQLFLFWEITTLCSWALIGFYQEEHGALAAAYKAFLITAGGGLALFAAVIILLAVTGSVDFGAIAALGAGGRVGLATVILVLLFLGAWAKSGQVPFHTWLPDAMVAPSPVSAYLHAASMVNAGAFLALRVVTASPAAGGPVPGALPSAVATLALVMGVVTLVVAVAQFFFQTDLKRLLALSTIAGLAYVFIGAALGAAGSLRAAQGAALHILAHGAGKGLLFLSAGSLSYAYGTRRIADLSGVLKKTPVPAIGFLIGALTVTGVPPFAGFWSKFALIGGAVQLGGAGLAVGVLLLAESVLAFAWFLWIGHKVFLGTPSAAVAAGSPTSRVMDLALVLLMVLCLLVPLFGLPLASAVGFGPGR
jgi:hydrogenase-4 component D